MSLSRYLIVLLLCVVLLLLHKFLARLVRLALRSSLWLAALALFRQVGQLFGVTLGVNPVNALVLGLLGAPGFALLLMLQWALAG
jgi:inhibitor of the pro-sigma K processing machinery